MGKILGYKQQRVQFFYDSLFRARGSLTTAVGTRTVLFAAASPGVLARTNMQVAGQLASDQTFLVYSIRHELYLRPSGASNGAGTNGLAVFDLDLRTAGVFRDTIHHTTFQFQVGEKVEFEGPWHMTPAGGGEWGFISDSVDVLLVNGEPSARAIYVLPLPIPVTKRQAIQMVEQFEDIPSGGGTGAAAVTVLTNLNNFYGVKIARGYIDGYHSRDVQ